MESRRMRVRGGWLWLSVLLQCPCSAYPDYPCATTIITQTLPCIQHHTVHAFVSLFNVDEMTEICLVFLFVLNFATPGTSNAT